MVTKTARVGIVIAFMLVVGLAGAFLARSVRWSQASVGSSAAAPSAQAAGTPSADGVGSQSAGVNTSSNAAASGLGMKSKGGGGRVALATFFILLSLWCLRGWWIARRSLLHRQ